MKTSTQAYREPKAASFALLIACAGCGTAVFARDWERGPQLYLMQPVRQPSSPQAKQPPRATLVATPIPVRRATSAPVQRAALIATATSSATT